MGRQRLIQRIQLGTGGCADDACNAQVSAIFAGTHGHCRSIEIRCMTLNDFKRSLRKTGLRFAHNLDWKITGIFDQGRLLSHGAR